jgi:hypothetical protein
MSYVTAPTFEGTRIGMRRLGVLSGIGGVNTLGLVADTANVLIATGWDASLVNGLLQAGATDQQLTDLLNGATDPTQILYQLKLAKSVGPGGIDPTVPPTSSPSMVQTALTTQPNSPNPASVPQSPPGSTLLYTVTYSQNISTPAPSDVMPRMLAELPTYRMSVAGSKLISNTYLGLGSATIQFTISDNVGHASLGDAQSVLDSLMRKYTYNSVTGSQISLLALPFTQAGTGGNVLPPSGVTGWLQSNWVYLAVGLGVLVLGPPLIKKL